jgi:flagellar hook-associated protein 2
MANLISGLSSGIDWKTMVDQLISVEHQRVDLVTSKQEADQSKLSEWQGVNTKLLALKNAAAALKDADAFNVYKANMTTDQTSVQGSDLLAVTASTSASAGSYTIKVNELATAQKRSSGAGTIASMTAELGSSYAGNLVINGETITIDATDTLLNLRDKINNANGGDSPTGVTASIVSYSATDNRLILTSDTKGVSGFTLTGDSNPINAFNFQLTAGTNSSLTVNGVAVTRTDNSITDLIPGVTLDLQKSDSTATITLTIGQDTDAIITKINALVTSYNNISSYIKTQSTYDDTKKQTGGLLFGDGTLSSVKSALTSTLTQSIWGVASSFSTLGLVGISVDKYGQLSLDKTKLANLLVTNFSDVVKLFSANGESTAGSINYISHSRNTQAGDYAVNITAAATKATSSLSNTSVSTINPLGETITITAGDDIAEFNVTNGMSAEEVAANISAEFAKVYTQSIAGENALYADVGLTAITAATTWDSIYDGSGNLVTFEPGNKTIDFTGTGRTGSAVSGSYTIGDGDSVQDLLDAVELAFGYEATAAINTSGQLVITDKSSGSSKLALTLNSPAGSNLNIGSILTTNTGGQKGRYAINIKASTVGGQLTLASNSYGTGHSFTIHQSVSDLLWTGTDQTAEGVDVAGTINGDEAATGKGQLLTGNTGDANVEGLIIQYTGTATGAVGSLKLTLGVAELFDRALFPMTDSIEGYVTFKQKSLQDKIERYGTQIDDMEARLARKKDMLLAQYAAMETALQKIQSQSSWLTAQTQAATNGWYKSSN